MHLFYDKTINLAPGVCRKHNIPEGGALYPWNTSTWAHKATFSCFQNLLCISVLDQGQSDLSLIPRSQINAAHTEC